MMQEIHFSSSAGDLIQNYSRLRGRKIRFAFICVVLIFFILGGASTLGPAGLSFKVVYSTIAARFFPGYFSTTSLASSIVWNIRLPRVLMGLLAGFGLGMSGAVMQSVLGNPLASPYTLGISAAAGFGASLAIIMGAGIFSGTLLLIGNAFIFSILCSVLIIALSSRFKGNPGTMVLAGIALGALFNAGTTLLQFIGDPFAVQAVVFWMIGDVGRSSWTKLGILGIILLVTTPLLIFKSWDLNSLAEGDNTAKSLGIHVALTRIGLMMLTSLLTATIVSFIGTIGFIGIVAPHLVRLTIGNDNSFVVPWSGLVGAVLLASADVVALNLLAPTILPVGVITAFMGVPLFLFLILRTSPVQL